MTILSHFANLISITAAPSVPAQFADSVLNIGGLQRHIQAHAHSRVVKMADVGSRSNNSQFLSPQQIRARYGADSSTLHGEGQVIAIVMDASRYANDLNAFWSQANVDQKLSNVSLVYVLGGNPNQNASSGDYLEACMDVEWASAMATGAQIRVYVVPSLAYVDAAYRQILSDASTLPGLRPVSLSYGLGETNGALSQFQADEQLFAQMAAAGITVFASSGDGGSSPSAGGHDHTGAVQAESPASCASVMGVGGTSQNYNFSTNTLNSEPVWYDGGGSIVFPHSNWQTSLSFPSNTGRLASPRRRGQRRPLYHFDRGSDSFFDVHEREEISRHRLAAILREVGQDRQSPLRTATARERAVLLTTV